MWTKSYKNTKAKVRELVMQGKIYELNNYVKYLKQDGHSEENIEKAIHYFMYGKQTEKFRQGGNE